MTKLRKKAIIELDCENRTSNIILYNVDEPKQQTAMRDGK